VRIGVRVPQYGSTWPELRAAAERIELLGFDGVWVNDHLQSPGRVKEEVTFDAFTTLGALAVVTRRARLGIAVLSASYRPPALAAKMATVLDVISDGRLVVGLGTGSDRAEHAAYGIPFGSPAERAKGVRRALEVIRAMAEHPDGATLAGELAGAPNRPEAVQRPWPPVWLAAHRPLLLRLAGERADGLVAAFVGPEVLAARLAMAEEARLRAGRPPLALALYAFALAAGSEREAESFVAGAAAAVGSSPRRYLRWLRTQGPVGRPDEVRDRLAAFGEAGATDAILALPSRLPAEALHALAEAVLPPAGPDTGPARTARAARPSANLVDLLVGRHRRAGRGGDPAVVDDEGAWSFDELGVRAARAAGALARAGVRRGERVAVVLPDTRAWFAAFLGAAWLGAVAVPLEPGGPRLAETLDDLEPAAVVAPSREGIAPGPLLLTSEDLDGPELPPAAVHPEDLAYMIFSSGSTGRPKGAMHAHRDLEAGVDGYARSVLAAGPGDRCHSVAKLFTSLGFGNGFFRVLGAGACAVLSPLRPTVRSVLGLTGRHGVNVLTAVPTFWAQLATFAERHGAEGSLTGLRLAISSGDSLPPVVAERLRAVLGVELLEGLGCSECSTIVLSTRPGEPLPGTLGRVVPPAEVRLADEQGRPVAPGTPGRLWIRSPSNTSGYWRRAEETRDLLYGEWVRMGDVLREEDGVYRHLGRADDLFKVDGRWVSPVEVESILHEHPLVEEAAVVGLPDGDGLVRAAAFVVLATGAREDRPGLERRLRSDVAHRLGPHAAPSRLTVMDELPRVPSGKVDRRALRAGRPRF
jgi:benzoate-CoA ligase